LKYSSVNRGFSAGNPIANVFVIVVGALAIGLSIVLGFVAFVVLGSVVAVLAAVIGLRLWWFNRKMRGNQPQSPGTPRPAGVIEGEFHVVDDDHRDERDD